MMSFRGGGEDGAATAPVRHGLNIVHGRLLTCSRRSSEALGDCDSSRVGSRRTIEETA